MAAVIKIEIVTSGGVDQVKKDVESLGTSAKSAGSGFSAMGEIATGALRAIGEMAVNLAGAALSKIGDVLSDSISAAKESNMVAAQTAQVIKSTGQAAGVTTQHVLDYASALSAASGKSLFGDEQIAQSTNLLLTFTNIKGATLDAATAISVDMAQALGGAPKDAAIQLGKALNDPVKGITALTRVGVTFTAEQKAQIQAMQEAGNTAGAQKIILAELNKEFGGSAAAAAAADGGWAQFHDRLGEVEETIGKAILPLLGSLVGIVNDQVLPVIEGAANAIGPFITGLQDIYAKGAEGQTGFDAIVGGLTNVIYSLDTISPLFDLVGDAINSLYSTFTDAPTPVQGFLNVMAQVSPTFAFVQATIAAVMPEIQITVTTALGVITQFWQANGADIMATVQTTWAQVQGIINTALPLIQEIIRGVLAVITGFIRDHGAAIQQALGDTWNIIKNVIQAALAFIQGILTAALDIMHGNWAGAWQAIQQMSVTVTLALGQIIKSFLDLIFSYFGTTLNEMLATWGRGWDAIKLYVTNIPWQQLGIDVIDGVISGLSGAGPKLAEAARKAAQDAYNAAYKFLENGSPSKLFAREIGKPMIQGITVGVQQETPNLLNAITGTASAAIQGATDLVSQFTGTLTSAGMPAIATEVGHNAIQGLINGVAGQVNDAKGGVDKLLSGMSGVFKGSGIADDANGIGGDIVSGLIDGMQNKLGDAVQAAHDAAKSLLGGFTDTLNISSPSQIMADVVGTPIITGIMQGMQQTLPGLIQLIDQIGGDVVAANKKWTLATRQAFQNSFTDIDNQIEKMGTTISNTISDAFTGAASLDRAKAKAIDALKDISDAQQKAVQDQLATADAAASAMSDPTQAAKFFKMRTDQIFEIAKLQDQVNAATDDVAKKQLQDQIALIQDAQSLEIQGAQKAAQSPTAALLDQLSQLQQKADNLFHGAGNQGLPGMLDGNATINAITALTNQLQQMASGGNSSTVNSSNSVFNYQQTITTSAPVPVANPVHVRAMAGV